MTRSIGSIVCSRVACRPSRVVGIYRRSQGGTYPASPTIIPANTVYQDGSAVSGATYCYEVTAFNGGVESAVSNESCARSK